MDSPGGKRTVRLGESGRSKAPKLDGSQKNAWVLKKMIVDGLRLRWRSQRDESGRSSKVRGYIKRMKVDGLRFTFGTVHFPPDSEIQKQMSNSSFILS